MSMADEQSYSFQIHLGMHLKEKTNYHHPSSKKKVCL